MPAVSPKYFQIPVSRTSSSSSSSSSSDSTMPPTTQQPLVDRSLPSHPKPLLRLELRDLSLAGSSQFLQNIDSTCDLASVVSTVLKILYPLPSSPSQSQEPSSSSSPTSPTTSYQAPPPTRSVTLIIRSMGGVAYTTGKDIDDDHKEIHVSAEYISGIASSRKRQEIMGVLVHEMVHCWQWNAEGSAPGGLIEGIADWVRLRAGLSPPHWKKEAGGDWDAGYQHTGYFLDWLEEKYGDGTVVAINKALKEGGYKEETFWKKRFGTSVKSLWAEYGKHFKEEEEEEAEAEAGGKDDLLDKQ